MVFQVLGERCFPRLSDGQEQEEKVWEGDSSLSFHYLHKVKSWPSLPGCAYNLNIAFGWTSPLSSRSLFKMQLTGRDGKKTGLLYSLWNLFLESIEGHRKYLTFRIILPPRGGLDTGKQENGQDVSILGKAGAEGKSLGLKSLKWPKPGNSVGRSYMPTL